MKVIAGIAAVVAAGFAYYYWQRRAHAAPAGGSFPIPPGSHLTPVAGDMVEMDYAPPPPSPAVVQTTIEDPVSMVANFPAPAPSMSVVASPVEIAVASVQDDTGYAAEITALPPTMVSPEPIALPAKTSTQVGVVYIDPTELELQSSSPTKTFPTAIFVPTKG